MKRRDFLTVLGSAAAAWPLAARAQQGAPIPRIGALMPYPESDPEARAEFKALVEGMQALGWTDGHNIRIEVRWTGGAVDAYRRLQKSWSRCGRT